MIFRRTVFCLGFTLGIATARPGWAASGVESASFLDIPVGAEPASLAGAYSALAADAYASVYNAAGLGFVNTPQLAGQHLAYLSSINDEFASLAIPLRRGERSFGGLGASIQYFSPGTITGRDDSGAVTGDFSGHYAAYTLAYGFPVTAHWSLGAAGKLVQAKIDTVTGSAYAADLGTFYRIRPQWTAAATLTNLGNRLTLLQDGQQLPTTYHLATAYVFGSSWLISLEGAVPEHRAASFHGGVEWSPVRALQLRAGYRTDTLQQASAIAGVTVGAGIRFWGQEFAYAWLPYGELGNVQYFSFLFRFGTRADDADDRHALKRTVALLPDSDERSR